MSLPLLHAGKSAPGLSAALDLRFALDKSLTAYRGPTPSFSRASTGSYFDGSGVLRYAVLNYLQYSEEFNAAYWPKYQSSVTANAIVAPDGKTTADKLVENSTNNVHGLNVTSFSTVIGQVYTLSIYAKAGERNWFSLNLSETGIADRNTWFNLANGTIGTNAAGNTPSITSVGNGWYRCSITRTMAVSNPMIFLELANADNTRSYLGDGSSGAYFWGAQLEASSTLGAYVQTTNAANSAPRFNHTFNGTSWVSRGLLVEEQRTNICLQSSGFSTASWTQYRGTVTANAATSPDGTGNASNFTQSTGQTVLAFLQQYATTTATQFTLSVFAKANGKNFIVFTERLSSAGERYTFFNVSAGSIGTSNAAHTARIVNVGNGWYRCSVTFTALAKNDYFGFNIGDADNSFTCTDSGSVLFYGAMLEAGSFSTSHIETTSASTTRSADVCQITGGDFSGFWNGTEGTIVGDFDRLFIPTGTASVLYTARDSANNNAIYYYIDVSNDVSEVYASGGSATFNFGSPVGAGISNKIATAYKANDFAASRNGSTPLTDTSGAVPSGQTLMEIGSAFSAKYLNGHIARLRYFNKRLPNATLQLLSDPDPTLNLQFALNKSLTPVAGPAPSFSRASTGTYFNASGVLTSASINTPRFDHVYSGGQWVSRGLLVEEQRTNAFQWSEDFSNAFWTKLNASIATSSGISPDGTNTANKITDDSTNGTHRIYRGNVGTAGQPCTTSFYLKAGTARYAIVLNSDNNDWRAYAVADLQTGTITQNGVMVAATGASYIGSSITNCGDGWYRVSVSGTNQNGDANYYGQVALSNSATPGTIPSYIGTGSYIYAVMAQMELNSSFPTSYIKTTSSTVTRSADVCQITGTSFNWMWNQGEGSFISECGVNGFNASGVNYIGVASVGSISQYAFVGRFNGSFTALNFQVYNGSPFGDITYTAVSATPTKTAFGIKANDCAASVNGGAILSDNTVTMTTALTQLEIGNFLGANNLNGHIAKLIYYPARLTNTKLQQLST